jgi:branched-chain amino acid aminotransferase
MADEIISYFNGEWIPKDECKISMDNRGFRLGDAVFEVDRTYGGKFFNMDDHMDRLFRSLKYTRMDPGISRDEMKQITSEAVERNWHLVPEGSDMNVRQVVTRGEGSSVNDGSPATVFVAAYPMGFDRYAHLYDEGAHVVFARTRSYHPDSLDPKVKHVSRMNFVLAELEASDVDPDSWPVLLDLDGNISEGTGFNFWVVTDGKLRTAGDRTLLQGVSRKTLLSLADELGIPVELDDIQLYDAYTADEAFVSGTSHCLLPVSKLDNRPIDGDVPGPVVSRLLAAWSERVSVDLIGQAQAQAGISS